MAVAGGVEPDVDKGVGGGHDRGLVAVVKLRVLAVGTQGHPAYTTTTTSDRATQRERETEREKVQDRQREKVRGRRRRVS